MFPSGASSVESDTLGLVRSRTGQVVSTALTRKHPAVYEIFCRWLREHQPAIFEHPFPSTSISVNHGYAARKSVPESKQPLSPTRGGRFGNSEIGADRSPSSEITVTQIDLSCLSGGGSDSCLSPCCQEASRRIQRRALNDEGVRALRGRPSALLAYSLSSKSHWRPIDEQHPGGTPAS